MLKRSILARTAVSTGVAAMSLAALLVAPSMAAAQSSYDVPVPPLCAWQFSRAHSA